MDLLAVEAGAPPAFLPELVALLVAAAAIGYVCARLRVVPIVGFLLAGVAIGPNALGLVRNLEVVDAAAEIGVILLLFTIGIEFSLSRLARIRRLILVGGGLQVLLATALTVGLLTAFGVDARAAVFTGFLVALSSTAIVLTLLGDRGETGSPHGQLGLAVLIFQDLAVVVMVLLVPILGGDGGSSLDVVAALATALGIIALVLVVARRLMPRVLEAVARACSPEVFLLAVIAICFGTAYLTSLAGVSVSLGAFLAGLVVSESRHSDHALGEILPLQILFAATFFLSVGMLLDVRFLVEEPLIVLAAVGGVLVIKLVTTGVSVLVLGVGVPTAAATALLLAQVGEFSFVLERVGRAADLTPAGLGEDGSQAFVASTVLLMVATPWLARLGTSLARRLGAARGTRLAATRASAAPPPTGAEGRTGHVVISGYGGAARRLVADLAGAGTRLVLVTLSPDGAGEAEDAGHDVLRGDSTKASILELAGIRAARMLVIADDDLATTTRIAALGRQLAPDLVIVARTLHGSDLDDLVDAGVDNVVIAEHASHAELSRSVLGQQPTQGINERKRSGTLVDPTRVVRLQPRPDTSCPHVSVIRPQLPGTPGCAECLRTGDDWVHLRLCMQCGHVGCCDSSPGRHAAEHSHAQEHPVMRSLEKGEEWGWCFLDATTLEVDPDALPAPATA